MLLRFEPSFPPFEHPQQRNAHSHADDRFGKAQQAVYGRGVICETSRMMSSVMVAMRLFW